MYFKSIRLSYWWKWPMKFPIQMAWPDHTRVKMQLCLGYLCMYVCVLGCVEAFQIECLTLAQNPLFNGPVSKGHTNYDARNWYRYHIELLLHSHQDCPQKKQKIDWIIMFWWIYRCNWMQYCIDVEMSALDGMKWMKDAHICSHWKAYLWYKVYFNGTCIICSCQLPTILSACPSIQFRSRCYFSMVFNKSVFLVFRPVRCNHSILERINSHSW